jgi:molybdenum cofactor cytidylyltransferase
VNGDAVNADTSPDPSANPVSRPGGPAAPRFGVILLAAGASTRMGEPKQLLSFQGQPLVVRAACAALESAAWPVIVVLGAHAEKVRPLLAPLPVLLVDNAAWAEGMASSLRAGLTALMRFSLSLDGALIGLCDQPYFSPSVIAQLRAAWCAPDGIAAARYAERTAVPALFSRCYFPELLALTGAEGARRVLVQHAACVTAVDLPELAFDIDTPADYQQLLAGRAAPPPGAGA